MAANQRTMLEPFGPKLPIPELVTELNRIYHAIEAPTYDASHPEIHEQLPPVWRALLGQAVNRVKGPLRILDFGSGTGFEAEQIVNGLPKGQLAALYCYDLAPEMVEICKARISPQCSVAHFTADLKQVRGPFDVLVTNAVLHHVPDVQEVLSSLESRLSPNALWLSGHEPSSRFYKNAECMTAYRQFLREDRWRKFLSPKRYQAKLAQLLGVDGDPAAKAAEIATRRGLFERQPPASVVSALVDFHVAGSEEEAKNGRGFDLKEMSLRLAGEWKLVWSQSYSFFGPYFEGDLAPRWAKVARDLASRFPDDGANWSAAWQRVVPAQT